MSDILKKRILLCSWQASWHFPLLPAETQIPQAEHRTFLGTFPKRPSKTQDNEIPSNTSEPKESGNTESDSNNILIAYFTAAENSGVDAIASASYTTIDGQAVGRIRAVADMIQENVGGDLFSIRVMVPLSRPLLKK